MSDARKLMAREIAQQLLDQTADALLSGDFDRFLPCFKVPHYVETIQGKQTIETVDAFQTLFQRVSRSYEDLQVTDLVRICDIAEFRSPTRIEATHTTHIMAGNQPVMEPYPCFAMIELIDDRWLVASSQYAVDKSTSHGRAFHEREHRAFPQ